MAIARFPTVVLDCPDAEVLARFYGALLDWKVEVSPDWAEIKADYGDSIGFQQVEEYVPPQWPGQAVPQQMHLDVVVDDLDTAEAAVLELGATKHEHQPGTTFRVFLDPAGHPLGVALAVVALTRIRRTGQGGRRLALAGLAISALWIAGATALTVRALTAPPVRAAGGQVQRAAQVDVDDLRAGDCVVTLPDP